MDGWKVGVLHSQTGCLALAERGPLNGTLMAIEEINAAGGVAGRLIEPVVLDTESDENKSAELVHKLIKEESINVVFGGYTSASRKAMLPVIEKSDSLLFYPIFYEGFELSDNVFYTGACPNQYSVPLSEYLFENYGNRFYLIGSNYVFPRESNRILRDLAVQNGGTIIAEKYVPLEATKDVFKPIIQDIAKLKPDVVISTIVGDGIMDLYSAFQDAGISSDEIPIASMVTSEVEIEKMGHAAAAGHIVAASYFDTIDSPENAKFVSNYKSKFGQNMRTNMCVESAYCQVHLFAHALNITQSIDTKALRAAVLGAQFNAPQGRIRMDVENHHTHLWSRIGQIEKNGNIQIVAETKGAIEPDPYMIHHAAERWQPSLISGVAK
ncbi:MAG: transporter substrate-binding domain-containing protein [Rhodospirillales bacterium]|jgi:urea ABC transporter urea binding protein|nr:transporter substrate-binding domain-containing protein [Rhodospirillales bacterium]